MGRQLNFRVLLNDTVKLDNRTSYTFFAGEETLPTGKRINTVGEAELVKWMLDNSSRKELFLGEVIPSTGQYFICQSITYPIVVNDERPGDVDILIFPKDHPELAIACEVKRVKVNIDKDNFEKVNRHEQIEKKGIKQVNQLYKRGFHQTYLVILIATDGKNRIDRNMAFRYGNSKQVQDLYNITFNEDLNENIGVIFVHIVEPSSALIDFTGYFAACADRRAKGQVQNPELTKRINLVKASYEQQKSILK